MIICCNFFWNRVKIRMNKLIGLTFCSLAPLFFSNVGLLSSSLVANKVKHEPVEVILAQIHWNQSMGTLEQFSKLLKIQRFSCRAQMTVLGREAVHIPVVVTNFRSNIFLRLHNFRFPMILFGFGSFDEMISYEVIWGHLKSPSVEFSGHIEVIFPTKSEFKWGHKISLLAQYNPIYSRCMKSLGVLCGHLGSRAVVFIHGRSYEEKGLSEVEK